MLFFRHGATQFSLCKNGIISNTELLIISMVAHFSVCLLGLSFYTSYGACVCKYLWSRSNLNNTQKAIVIKIINFYEPMWRKENTNDDVSDTSSFTIASSYVHYEIFAFFFITLLYDLYTLIYKRKLTVIKCIKWYRKNK